MWHFSGIKFAAGLAEETHNPLPSHEIRRKRTRRQNFSLDAQEENHPFSHCRYSYSFRSPLTLVARIVEEGRNPQRSCGMGSAGAVGVWRQWSHGAATWGRWCSTCAGVLVVVFIYTSSHRVEIVMTGG